MNRRIAYAMLAGLAFVGLSCIAARTVQGPGQNPDNRAESAANPMEALLEERDYSALIQQCKAYIDETGYPNGVVASAEELSPNPDRAERMVAGGWATPGNIPAHLIETLIFARKFYFEEGRLPQDGKELARWYLAQTRTLAALEDIVQRGDEARVDALAIGLNPVTGRFYGSFELGPWQPGAVSFQHLQDDESFYKYTHTRRADYQAKHASAPEIWRVHIWGTSEGEVLLDKMVSAEMPSSGYSPPGGGGNPCAGA